MSNKQDLRIITNVSLIAMMIIDYFGDLCEKYKIKDELVKNYFMFFSVEFMEKYDSLVSGEPIDKEVEALMVTMGNTIGFPEEERLYTTKTAHKYAEKMFNSVDKSMEEFMPKSYPAFKVMCDKTGLVDGDFRMTTSEVESAAAMGMAYAASAAYSAEKTLVDEALQERKSNPMQ